MALAKALLKVGHDRQVGAGESVDALPVITYRKQELTSIEQELAPNAPPPDGDILKAYNRVRVLLNLDPSRKDISDAVKQVLSGLASIVHGLATMRNKMSDAHGTLYRPTRHHAKLAVNSAKTLADFLFETLAYQKSTGKIKKP